MNANTNRNQTASQPSTANAGHGASPLPAAAARWSLDAAHSAVTFSVRHLMITNVRGEFGAFRGDVAYDASRPEATRVEATIDVASLSTRDAKRDADLKSALFFDAERAPEMKFVSKRVRVLDGTNLDVVGDLTIRGTTHEVTLAVRDIATAPADMRGNPRVGATASTQIKRSDFGMTWNKALDAGGVVVGDVVTITLEVSLVKGA